MMTTETLRTMDDESFRSLVNDEIRGNAEPEVTKLLRSPELVDRWYNALQIMQKSVEGQLAAKKAEAKSKKTELTRQANGRQKWLQYNKSANIWRAGALRFKSGLEMALFEADQLRYQINGVDKAKQAIGERNVAIAEAERLKSAIRAHRTHVLGQCPEECDGDYCVADEDLWAVLGEPQ
jgi:hypothetical protein